MCLMEFFVMLWAFRSTPSERWKENSRFCTKLRDDVRGYNGGRAPSEAQRPLREIVHVYLSISFYLSFTLVPSLVRIQPRRRRSRVAILFFRTVEIRTPCALGFHRAASTNIQNRESERYGALLGSCLSTRCINSISDMHLFRLPPAASRRRRWLWIKVMKNTSFFSPVIYFFSHYNNDNLFINLYGKDYKMA